MSFCQKCKLVPGTILLRLRDLYCNDCFLTNVSHKFRACIGKNRILTQNENVLICLNGGLGSTILLNLVLNGLALNNHKKLLITPVFFHLIGTEENKSFTKLLIEQCMNQNYDINLCHISEYMIKIKSKPKLNHIPERNEEAHVEMKKKLSDMSSSTRNDYLAKIKRELFICYAKELQCNSIFTAETSTTLAIKLISNLSLGRGSQVQHDIGFCDNRNEVKILRPIKDITLEEIQHYITISQLTPLNVRHAQEYSLQSVAKLFVNDLQQNFQSTISTICKTAEKIGIQNENKHKIKCLICESGINKNQCKLTALEATNYSKIVSMAQQESTSGIGSPIEQQFSMFPHVNKYLCYACSKNYSEMKSTVPLNI
ncbi:unnamed protein product [Chilo suppressalis]|uniref:Cytoplasmic tRNA 2-thiolation protein 2 n=1 Tax=Chilo suppressalis TaxID=168631 RepID=A0ABN8BCW7_CHISP|nr:unnamed protein product [Chilo suppressalis]